MIIGTIGKRKEGTDIRTVPAIYPMDRIDCVFKKKHHWIVEIKVRNQDWDSLFMEVSKYNAMNKMMLDCGMYVNFIGDKCSIFSLKRIKRFIRDCFK